jgi:hypothetical protein
MTAQHRFVRAPFTFGLVAAGVLSAVAPSPAHGQSVFGDIAASGSEPLGSATTGPDTNRATVGAPLPAASVGTFPTADPFAGDTTVLPPIGATAAPIGTATLPTSTPTTPTIGTSLPPTIGTPTLPTIGTSLLPTIGTPTLPTIGTSTLPTIGTSLAPTIGTTLDPTIGPPAPSIGSGTMTPIGATRSPGAAPPEVPPLTPGTAIGSGSASSAAGFGGSGGTLDSQCSPEDFTCRD